MNKSLAERGRSWLQPLCWAPALLFFTACAHTPEPKIVTQTVKVPVTVACVPADIPAKPSYADEGLSKSTPADERYLAIATANAQRKVRLGVVEPIINSCR